MFEICVFTLIMCHKNLYVIKKILIFEHSK